MVSRRSAWTVAILATLTMTISYIDRQTFSVLAPHVTEALGISETGYGWLTTAFSLAYLISTPLSGMWIDRVGARRGLVRSVLVWSTFAALHALVPNFAVLFALRLGLAFAEGPGFPGAAQTVQRILPPEHRSRGFGMLFTGSSIGAMIVPPLAAYLYATTSWRITFLLTSLVALTWLPIWIFVTSRPGIREQLDTVPAGAARPRLATLLRNPDMIRALIGVFVAAPLTGFATFWGAKYLVRAFHVDQKDVGHFLWLPGLGLDAGALLFGDLYARLRHRPIAPRILYICAALLGTTLALLPFADSPWQGTLVLTISLAGGGAMYTVITATVMSRMPPEAISFAGGTVACAQSAAGVIMGPFAGLAIQHFQSYSQLAVFLGMFVIPGAILWLALRPKQFEHQV